jgi:hypothetical protein
LNLASPEAWESLAREDASATFFQTPVWHRVTAPYLRAESVPLLFETASGPACLPLLRDRRWGRDRYFSPLGTYTALLCPQKLETSEIGEIAAALSKISIHLVSSPFTRNPLRAGRALPNSTRFIDLTALDPEAPMRAWKEDQRWRARAAARDGLTVRLAESSRDWDSYLELYARSLDRWGGRASSRYPATLFAAIRREVPQARLWLAEQDGRVGAGYLAFYHNTHAALWHGAANSAFFAKGANQLLYATMIADAARRGFRVLDLLPSGGHAGVEAFKARFGSQHAEFESSLNSPGLVGWLSELKRGILKTGT